MGYSEYPHFYSEDDDMHEFIHMYRELVDKYSGTLESIRALDVRLTQYQNDMNARIANLIDVVIPEKVSSAVELEMRQYEAELSTIRENIETLETELSTLNTKVDNNDIKVRALIQAEVTALEDKILELREEVLQELESAIESVNDKISGVNGRIDSLSELMEAEDSRIESKIDHFIANFEIHEEATLIRAKAYTDERCDELKDMINELQPVTAKKRCKWLWDYGCNFGGYNVMQWYNDTSIGVQKWHDTKFSWIDWYVRGREIWSFFDRCRFMFSPVSGRFVNVRTVVLELITIIKGKRALTAQEYEDLALSAGEYDSMNISGFDYDWNGKEVIDAHKGD